LFADYERLFTMLHIITLIKKAYGSRVLPNNEMSGKYTRTRREEMVDRQERVETASSKKTVQSDNMISAHSVSQYGFVSSKEE
jgi:hypothetical protein